MLTRMFRVFITGRGRGRIPPGSPTTSRTPVVITHEMAVVKEICHRVAVMEKGTPNCRESWEMAASPTLPRAKVRRAMT